MIWMNRQSRGTVRKNRVKINQNYLIRLLFGLKDWPPRDKADPSAKLERLSHSPWNE